MVNAGREVCILNTANRSSLPFLDAQAVVEVPCLVGPGGVVPVAVGDVPMEAQGPVLQVRAVRAGRPSTPPCAARAAGRSRSLALHPLVPSVRWPSGSSTATWPSYPALAGGFA